MVDSLTVAAKEPGIFSTSLDKKAAISVLDHLTCYAISGDDAQTFLQGQLTNDINEVTPTQSQLSSYCTPKGRMLAIFRICLQQDKYLLFMRKDVAESVIKRLQMFVLRAKVEIKEHSIANIIIGLTGELTDQMLDTLNLHRPTNDNEVAYADNSLCMKIPGVIPRYLLIGDETFITNLEKLDKSTVDVYASSYWQWLDIMSGIPTVTANTQESFVPQMANMELINGVSFSKGCYPGQEIVARLHYLGNASRRMFRIEISTDKTINPGDDIYQSESDSNQAIGSVVSAIKEDADKFAGLAVLRIEAAQQNKVSIGSPAGIPATIMSLPYEVPTEKKE